MVALAQDQRAATAVMMNNECPRSYSAEVAISPSMAAQWLEKNAHNRPVRRTVVQHYARQMSRGEWRVNGESIKFDWDDVLEDGQHRLFAIIASGETIQMTVYYNLDPSSFSTIDTGVGRTMGDNLALRGESNYNVVAGALRILWRYEQGIWHRGGGTNPSHKELLVLLDAHPLIRRSATVISSCKHVLKPSLATCLHYLFASKDAELAAMFFEGLATGIELRIDEPVRVLRERLMTDRASKSRLKDREVHALVIVAWNLTRTGRSVKSLRWISVGDSAEEFPTIV